MLRSEHKLHLVLKQICIKWRLQKRGIEIDGFQGRKQCKLLHTYIEIVLKHNIIELDVGAEGPEFCLEALLAS